MQSQDTYSDEEWERDWGKFPSRLYNRLVRHPVIEKSKIYTKHNPRKVDYVLVQPRTTLASLRVPGTDIYMWNAQYFHEPLLNKFRAFVKRWYPKKNGVCKLILQQKKRNVTFKHNGAMVVQSIRKPVTFKVHCKAVSEEYVRELLLASKDKEPLKSAYNWSSV